jgi:hypothetical protein
MTVTEGVALNLLQQDLRKEAMDIMIERRRLKVLLGGQRHNWKEVQESHKHQLAASTEAARAAEDRAS